PLVSVEELKQPIVGRPPDWRKPQNVDVAGLEHELRRNVQGEVRFDAGSKAMYAVDAGNYRQVPIGVVVPRTKLDVIHAVAACREYGAPLLSRGGGTGIPGQTCNHAIVIDWSKYMHGLLGLNLTERWARVLPGTICDELRDRAMQESRNLLTWGPDPATHTHCCFGGMIGNNSCGAHAQMSGKTDQNVEELEILLYDGTHMTVGWMDERDLERRIAQGGRTGDIFRRLQSLRAYYADLIRAKYPRIPRRVSGYNLDNLLADEHGRFNVARALVGSEGTLVTVLEAKVRLIDAKAERVILMLGYPDVYEAADHVPEIDQFHPTALEGIDNFLRDNIQRKGGPHARYLKMLPEGNGWLMAEFGAERRQDAIDIANRVMDMLKKKPSAPAMKLFTDAEDIDHLWQVRESGLGTTAFVPGQPDTWEGWEDSAVAPDKLGGYLRELRALYNKYQYISVMYGHFGQGCVHCRVSFGLTSESGIRTWRSFMEEATDLCVRYGGSLSGEHGDGQARGEFLYKMFGDELIEAFREYKSIWDPDWKMNPGKLVDAYRIDENLRLGAHYRPWQPETHFKYPDDHGSFAHAALRCVGVGKCRRKDSARAQDDTMCPSFMVKHEERHTTRGRAHHLWEMLNGNVIADGWRDENVKESLDLCLSCKGCKGDCPVNVDIATYKAEFLSHYWQGRIRPRHAYAFGLVDQWSRLASLWPGMVNLVTQTPGLSHLAKLAAGMPLERQIPEFAPETFRTWFNKRRTLRVRANGRVILWPDTFNNYFFPETAQAATEVLESAGFRVEIPQGHLCCGRPLYDYGMLETAKTYLRRILNTLRPQIEEEIPIVVLEPSCASVFRDELHNLFPNDILANKLREQTLLLSEFLEKKAPDFLPQPAKTGSAGDPAAPVMRGRALVQGHCHHKSLLKFEDESAVLKKLGLDYEVLASGCCGMAGSFGFERDKYDVSVAIGERKLLPAVRQAPASTLIVADGFSCREQIAQQTGRRALHLAEVIQLGRDHWSGTEQFPERELEERRKKARRTTRMKALAIVAGISIAGFGASKWLGR
ncbi:MAG TPA: FAD-linked oxidase C-terminal domain-containing protein, partial [Terriglobales bacterium]|nr:FAD-linked oxidase C-terminal domain-containing protein [Terriglobales bacterium]